MGRLASSLRRQLLRTRCGHDTRDKDEGGEFHGPACCAQKTCACRPSSRVWAERVHSKRRLRRVIIYLTHLRAGEG
jgi:hypothetical protein